MNSGDEVPSEFVVSSGDAPEILDPAEAAFDDVASSVGSFVEAMDANAIGFVGDYGLGAALDDLCPQIVAVVALVGKQSAHLRCERQNVGRSRDVGILARRQMKNHGPAKRIAQRMNLGRAPAVGTADRLVALPPFPPEAQR